MSADLVTWLAYIAMVGSLIALIHWADLGDDDEPAEPAGPESATWPEQPTVSTCLCPPPGCGVTPCHTYAKEHAYR